MVHSERTGEQLNVCLTNNCNIQKVIQAWQQGQNALDASRWRDSWDAEAICHGLACAQGFDNL